MNRFCPFGRLVGASSGSLGALLGPLGALLALSWRASWASRRPLGGFLGPGKLLGALLGPSCGPLGALLVASWALLGPS